MVLITSKNHSLLPATEADLPTLINLLTTSYFTEALCPFMFASWPDTKDMLAYFTQRVLARHSESSSELLKVVDAQDGKIIAMCCLSLMSADAGSDPLKFSEDGKGPEGINLEFAGYAATKFVEIDKWMMGKRHFLISSCAVTPECQGQGIGSAMVNYCVKKSLEGGLPTYLTAFPRARSMYAKCGFEVVQDIVLDLNSFGTKDSGYGLYRGYGMIINRHLMEAEVVA
ncbi:acyl-CoA N-acyltransferase [Tricladium varicosporioides]|nr:acyl-CoA N-acyltransferase [Hymenoscyphus varicosporioides]